MDVLFNFLKDHRKKFIALAAAAIVAIGSTYILGADNAIEQGAETYIESQTGVDIDFSPEK